MENNEKYYALLVGSRDFNNYNLFMKKCDYFLSNYSDIVVVSGGARGTDALAKRYAKDKGYEYIEFPAEWDRFGKRAGFIRNQQMHKFIAEKSKRGVIAFWDGQSKGTQHNFDLAKSYDNPLRIVRYK